MLEYQVILHLLNHLTLYIGQCMNISLIMMFFYLMFEKFLYSRYLYVSHTLFIMFLYVAWRNIYFIWYLKDLGVSHH